MFNKDLGFNKRGFTFLEVIIAIFVISIGVLALVRVMPSIISGSSLNNDRLTAAYLAQEGIEIVRNVRDSNWLWNLNNPPESWSEGIWDHCQNGCEADYRCVTDQNPNPSNPVPCLKTCNMNPNPNGCNPLVILTNTGLYGYKINAADPDIETKFKRTIDLDSCGSDCLEVSVYVYWKNRGKNYDFSVHEKMYKYNW